MDKLLAWRERRDPSTHRHMGNEYFVTFKGQSHLHAAWIPESQLLSEGTYARTKLQKFLRNNPTPTADEFELFNPLFCEVDRVLAARPAAVIAITLCLTYPK